jgi:hypothetical protein
MDATLPTSFLLRLEVGATGWSARCSLGLPWQRSRGLHLPFFCQPVPFFFGLKPFQAALLKAQNGLAWTDGWRAEPHRSCSVDGCNWVLEANLLPIGWPLLRLLAPRITGARFPIQIRCSAEAWPDWRWSNWGWTCESASPTSRRTHSDPREHCAEMLNSGLSLQSAVCGRLTPCLSLTSPGGQFPSRVQVPASVYPLSVRRCPDEREQFSTAGLMRG